ncbi:helix-turn-helix domain-containing protein [Demequina sp. NBRC 110052]|uniref:helix-turn-helix domain-containing protein n=1 Tax=Demequina sp. NBRC 110052 TaxID=1570341 RepID=UPI000A00DC98|nr:helix-turn-helix domain-containing protein [Demequina sp. NBRC 110052]
MQIAEHTRERVVELLHEGHGRNEIARRVGISGTSVGKIAREQEVSFDRSKTAEANRITAVDARYKRLALADNLLNDIEGARARLAQCEGAAQFRWVAQAIDALTRSYVTIQRMDGDDGGADEARGILTAFMTQVHLVTGHPMPGSGSTD